jgi:GT2 family glycosyltransferase
MPEEPSVSLIVLNWNGRQHLDDCLGSLVELDYPADRLQLIMCDNGSIDGSADYVRSRFPGIEVVALDGNYGFAEGNDRAVSAATGAWVGFLNNDMHVEPGWLRQLLEPLHEQPNLACLASRIANWDGSAIDFIGGGVNFQGHGFQVDHGQSTSPNDCPRRLLFACGGAMLVRRDLFLEVGGFDPDYFAFFEDVDLGWRLNLLGHDVWYEPRATTFHRHHGTASQVSAHRLRVLYERNALFTIYKCFDDNNLAAALPAALYLLNEKALRIARTDMSDYILEQPRKEPADEPPGSARRPAPSPREGIIAKVIRLTRSEGVRGMLRKALRRAHWQFDLLMLDLRRFSLGARLRAGAGVEPLPRVAMSHYVALSDFAHHLEHLRAKREWLQSRRVRSDDELLPLFHNALDPSYNDEHYVRFHHWLSAVLGLDQRFGKGEG